MKKTILATSIISVILTGCASPSAPIIIVPNCDYENINSKEFILKGNNFTKNDSVYSYGSLAKTRDFSFKLYNRFLYSELVNKKGKVLPQSKEDYETKTKTVLLSNCQKVFMLEPSPYQREGKFEDFIYTEDLSLARSLIGTTIYSRKSEFSNYLTEEKWQEFPKGTLDELTVVDVEPSTMGHSVGYQGDTFYLLAKTKNDKKVYVPFNEREFYYKYPIKETWDIKTQDAIKKGELLIGMTKEQTTIVTGMPEKINRTTTSYGIYEFWIFKNFYLSFLGNELKSHISK